MKLHSVFVCEGFGPGHLEVEQVQPPDCTGVGGLEEASALLQEDRSSEAQ